MIFDLQPSELGHSTSVQDAYHKYNSTLKPFAFKNIYEKPSIIIDNGSYECRAGWSFEEIPYLRFRNLVAKPKTSVNK